MADFKKALAEVLKNEGGYVNDPKDPGGETYKGISRNNWPKWYGWKYVDAKEFSSLSLQKEVEAFYKINFWDKVKGDDINSQEVATVLFDFAVNAGVATSSKLMQRAVGDTVDGIIGEGSVRVINNTAVDTILSRFTILRITRYVEICKRRPESKKYFFGWVVRTLGID